MALKNDDGEMKELYAQFAQVFKTLAEKSTVRSPFLLAFRSSCQELHPMLNAG